MFAGNIPKFLQMPGIVDSLYAGAGFSNWEIGDITVIKHNGEFHLFHLIIPNHDYIAHAVSNDGISWRRVKNALFVGDPGDWDDDMLWTMHVCYRNNRFEMYYTGLQRSQRGATSRIGLAVSDDMFNWTKEENNIFPFGSQGPHYESEEDNPRTWLSFRDPYFLQHDKDSYFLVCARASYGPVSRRGCVGIVKLGVDSREYLPPLHYPMVYDDVECPCAFDFKGRHYLIGSIREDVKVRYWFAPEFLGEYHAFHSNVLMPQGNYAARIVRDDSHLLIYAFFFTYGKIDSLRVLLPPKELDVDNKGRLVLKSYHLWQTKTIKTLNQHQFRAPRQLFNNPTASAEIKDDNWVCGSRSGYELFAFKKPADNFIWEGVLTVEGMGKLGLVTDADDEGSGYYFSFDVVNGHIQVRAWGYNPDDYKSNFIFITLQDNFFLVSDTFSYHFQLIRYGGYIELSIDGIVKITLADYKYNGKNMGIYSASSVFSLKQSVINVLPSPTNEYGTPTEQDLQNEEV